MLEVSSLSVSYGKIRALRDVSLHVKEGEAVAVLGANGAGKSTLLQTIAGALSPASGTLSFLGSYYKPGRPEKVVRTGISLVPESRRIFGSLSVRENLKLGMTISQKTNVEDEFARVFEYFPALSELLERSGGSLSGGQQQQLAIARAVLSRPKLLMLDEPSLGLSPVMVDSVFRAIVQLRENGTSILLVEQNARRAVEVTDRAYGLRGGQVQFESSSAEIAQSAEFDALYLGDSK